MTARPTSRRHAAGDESVLVAPEAAAEDGTVGRPAAVRLRGVWRDIGAIYGESEMVEVVSCRPLCLIRVDSGVTPRSDAVMGYSAHILNQVRTL